MLTNHEILQIGPIEARVVLGNFWLHRGDYNKSGKVFEEARDNEEVLRDSLNKSTVFQSDEKQWFLQQREAIIKICAEKSTAAYEAMLQQVLEEEKKRMKTKKTN